MEPVEAILEELQEPSVLYLGNPKLLSELTDWSDDGCISQLIVKHLDKSDPPQQAEVWWIASIAHNQFRLSVDGGW